MSHQQASDDAGRTSARQARADRIRNRSRLSPAPDPRPPATRLARLPEAGCDARRDAERRPDTRGHDRIRTPDGGIFVTGRDT